jgi:hypothetical protein
VPPKYSGIDVMNHGALPEINRLKKISIFRVSAKMDLYSGSLGKSKKVMEPPIAFLLLSIAKDA